METSGVSPLLRLAWYMARKRFTEFDWGRNDCNTFVVEMHDYVYDTNYLPRLYEKYNSMLSAAKFSRRVIQAPDWLEEAGYVPGLHRESGCILLEPRGSMWNAWVVLQDRAYSFTPEHNLTVADAAVIENIEVWRYNA